MSSPKQLNMADASAAVAAEQVVDVQQRNDHQDQHEQDHDQQELVSSTDDAPMSEDCETTEHNNASNMEIDDASRVQHVVQEDFEGDDKAPQDAPASDPEDTEDDEEDAAAGSADDTEVVGAEDENVEAAPDADGDVEAAAIDGDGGDGVEVDAADADSADVEVAPVGDDDGVEDADAVVVEVAPVDAGGVAAAPGEAEAADGSVDVETTPAAAVESDVTGGKVTVADNADVVEAEAGSVDAITADASANAGDEIVEADAQGTAAQHMEDSSINVDSAEDNEHDTSSNQDPQQQEDTEMEHQRDEYDPADPGYDENAYDPENALHHAQDEYDPADAVSSSYERHGSDEYDPANPGGFGHDEFESAHHAREEYDPENPSYGREEYDPSNPSYAHDNGDIQGSTSKSATDGDRSEPNPANKRKSGDSETASEYSQSERDLKRPRGDSHDSTKSADSKRQEDKKGLTDAAWDRLKDFQTLGEFQINQVSRAAFASVGALPEFAQVSIIARFTRVSMKEVRDKNGQLMRIHHEYLKENPHVASLKPVSVYIADFASDPGLFEFGYAPPLPVHGMSSVPVPYQKDLPVDSRASRASTMTSPRAHVVPAAAHGETSVKPQTTDEFGRVINKSVAASPSVSEASNRSAGARATDPRRAVHERAESSQTQSSSRAEGGLLAAGKPIDPRRRHAGESEFVPRSLGGGPISPRAQPGDPRRRSNLTSSAPPPSPHPRIEKNELYDRLPRSVRLILDNMVREGRLQEGINDNVISRLNHLPEHIALRAVENFSNVDLTQIDNLQGFLVGIINRVNEKAIAAERTEPPRVSSAASTPPPHAASGPSSGFGHEGEAMLAYPTGAAAAAARQGGRQAAYTSEQQQAAYRGSLPPDHQSGYDRQYDAQPPPQQHQQLTMDSSVQRGGPPSFPTNSIPAMSSAGTPALPQQQQQPTHLANAPGPQHGIGSLPLSVQQHLQTMAATGVISSIDEFGDKCYEVLGQLSEGLANEVLTRFTNANLTTVRNRSGFLIGVVKRCRQEYGFN